MTVFALDTTSTLASVAIRRDGVTVSEVTLTSTDGFGHRIFPAIEKCRNEANLRFTDVDCFAAAAGPGSFTGLRVALGAVKGLAESTGKLVCGVSNLRAVSSFGKTSSFRKNALPLRAVALDARRSQIYAAVYDAHLRAVFAETVLTFSAFLAQLDPTADYEFLSPAELPLAGTPFAQMPFTQTPAALAAAVALCAERDGAEGLWLDPAALDANYVRRADADLFWKE